MRSGTAGISSVFSIFASPVYKTSLMCNTGFPEGSVVKNLPANAGDAGGAGFILGSGRSPGGGNGNSLHYSCLGNSMDRGDWQAKAHGVERVRND